MKKILIFLLIVGVIVGTGYYIINFTDSVNTNATIEQVHTHKQTKEEKESYKRHSEKCLLLQKGNVIPSDYIEDIIVIAESNPECLYMATYSENGEEISLYDVEPKSRFVSAVIIDTDDGGVKCTVQFEKPQH